MAIDPRGINKGLIPFAGAAHPPDEPVMAALPADTVSRRTSHDGHPWVVINTRTQRFECRRCGGSEDLKLPDRLEVWLLRSKLFIREHRKCKEAKP